ncbi:MAG: energy transducer TonB [Candidatus Korobacteraceae bacterium]
MPTPHKPGVDFVPMRLVTVAFALIFAGTTHAQSSLKADCDAIVPQLITSALADVSNPKFRRPPMVAFEVSPDGSVTRIRIARKSGVPELDERLRREAAGWKYKQRVGCGVAL